MRRDCRFKKAGISSLGIKKVNLIRSLTAGLIGGAAYIVVGDVLPAIMYGWGLEPPGYIFSRLAYFIFLIALFEEIIFRGYIQTRLYGLIKNDVLAVSTGALMFSLMHAPAQLASGNRVFDASFVLWLAFTFIMHIVFTALYRKFNSAAGPVIFHALWNFRGEMFTYSDPPWWYENFSVIVYLLLTCGICVYYFTCVSREKLMDKKT